MRIAKLAQTTAIVTLLLAASAMCALSARADQDTFLNGPDDTFTIDQDGPDQDPKYDEDDPKYDEMDDLDHEEEDEARPHKQSMHRPIDRIETFWI